MNMEKEPSVSNRPFSQKVWEQLQRIWEKVQSVFQESAPVVHGTFTAPSARSGMEKNVSDTLFPQK